ncbi:MAG: tRNA (N6-threonylcarbamoyladenosine(37)-N6)-methyltransferase TrmO [Dehalococcoidales bacterium]|jgi:tRNA-Thr(GGU) m(6)t(6)A37 methyltransferase TsaA
MSAEITLKFIGMIYTPYSKKENTPIQGCFAPNNKGYIELLPEYTEGLQGISGFSHLILIYFFHQAEGCALLTKPFLDKDKKGIFAIRHFNRPNPIGLSVVKLYGVKDNILNIGGVDMLDGTPLLDIKPYVPEFDIKEDAKSGWLQDASERAKYQVEE